MTGKLWLSEAIDLNEIESGKMNIIEAPTGSGKTNFALAENGLCKLASKNSKYLYVIDTINGREQILSKNNNTAPYGRSWEEYLKNGKQDVIVGEWLEEEFDESKIVVITYAKFGALMKRVPNFGFNFDVILCDEIHSGVEMKNYNPTDYNYALKAIERIKDIISINTVTTKVVALTATPQRAETFFNGMIKHITVNPDIRRYEEFNTIRYTGLDYILKSLNAAHKGIIYTSRINKTNGMIDIWEKLKQRGIKAIAIWSLDSKTNPMTDEQLRARNYLLANEAIPPEYNFLIINKSLETGINIDSKKGKIDYILIHRDEKDVQIQARGRYRGDLDTQYLYSPKGNLTIPDEYLNRPLSKEERNELCGILALKNKSYNEVGWQTVEKTLLAQGIYDVERKKYSGKWYRIITKKNANF